jgi:hypothetical protein
MKQVNATFGGMPINLEMQTKNGQLNREVLGRKLLGAASGLVLAGMLVAGLWPFHSPRNQVTWLADGHGARVGRHGTILCSGSRLILDDFLGWVNLENRTRKEEANSLVSKAAGILKAVRRVAAHPARTQPENA